MKVHHYVARIDKAALRLRSMTGCTQPTYLALKRLPEGWREVSVLPADAAAGLADGTIIRVNVSNPERSVGVFVDPKEVK